MIIDMVAITNTVIVIIISIVLCYVLIQYRKNKLFLKEMEGAYNELQNTLNKHKNFMDKVDNIAINQEKIIKEINLRSNTRNEE